MSSTGGTPGAEGARGSRSSQVTAEPPVRRSRAGRPAGPATEADSQAADEESLPQPARRRRWWPFAAPIALIALGASLVTPAGRHQWALSLFRQPTDYTALAFNKAWTLPATAAWDAPLSISFSVSNHEGRTIRYRYLLSEAPAADSRTATTLRQSARVVPAGATWTVSTSVRPTCASSSCRVEVSLPGYPETIDFLVNLTFGPPAGG
jgi:hypothetical protein